MNLDLPIDYNAIRAAISDTITLITKMPCILEEQSDQKFKRPDIPYFSFKITTPGSRGGDDSMEYVTDRTWNRGGQRKMSVSFHCYAPHAEDAYGLMALWQAKLDHQTIQEVLRRAGIAVWTIGNVADLSKLLNTGYEARAQMDVQFGIASNLVEDLGSIEHAKISADIDTNQGHEIINFTTPP